MTAQAILEVLRTQFKIVGRLMDKIASGCGYDSYYFHSNPSAFEFTNSH